MKNQSRFRLKVWDPFMPDTPADARKYLMRSGLEKIHSAAHLRKIRRWASAPDPSMRSPESFYTDKVPKSSSPIRGRPRY